MENKSKKHRDNVCERNREIILRMAADPEVSLTDIKRAVGSGRTRIREFLERNGIRRFFSKSLKAEKSPQWRGGRFVAKDGYVEVYAPSHPNRHKHTPYVYEHRLVMESHIGRYLLRNEVVHHKNGNPSDNRIENLELFSSNGEHLKYELTGRCPNWSKEGKDRILKSVSRPRPHVVERNAKAKSSGDVPKCM